MIIENCTTPSLPRPYSFEYKMNIGSKLIEMDGTIGKRLIKGHIYMNIWIRK